ncbi:hypothetical protein AGR4A_pAt30008 [Agrobacterium tumefaciens str. B6]|uniref:Uncharacterized protein n=1 Tax=Agrobacterium tumefaciens str. B6 TaxID=1183423 RepID=A0A822VBA4_AGRTU|nr:hypothetical protein AGR4A_pAt30008 [Agrobacterium tumefaciens str. B6]
MDGFPFREVVLPIATAGPFLVFFSEMRKERTVALWPNCRRKRMVVCLSIVTHDLNALLDHPVGGRRYETGAIREVVTVFVFLVPARINDQHVTFSNGVTARLLQVVVGDRLPLLLRDRNDNAGAEEVWKWDFVNERRSLDNVRWRINVRCYVHRCRDGLRKNAGFCHVMHALDANIFEVRPVGALVPEAMREIVELDPHGVIEVILKFDPTDSNGHTEILLASRCGA